MSIRSPHSAHAAVLLVAGALSAVGCTARDPAIGSQPASEPALALSADGDALGPITAGTPFEASELRALLPAATVTSGTEATEGEARVVLTVRSEGARLLVRGDTDGSIDSVEILGASSVAGLDAALGDAFAEVFPPGSLPRCAAGSEEASGLVLCEAPDRAHVSLVFGGSWDGPDGELPPPETLGEWRLERLLWKP